MSSPPPASSPESDASSSDAPGPYRRLRDSFERFCPLPDAVWEDLRHPWETRRIESGQVLTAAGDVERRFGLILNGVQRAYFTTPDGEAYTVAFAYAGDYSGIPDSFFLQSPSAYTLEAASDGRILHTDYDRLSALMERHRELERWAWRLLASALRGRAKREREQMTLSAEERYKRLLDESPQIVQLVPLKHVASYLGMSPETLSRVRASSS